ncbi:MAG: hypothetical protein ALECFALPRED_010077 [Alectoria fallacina]|uniref:Uncharacterized protein n=1 Tax=Alectoria fallacina TaxID=1903189 RepID=A0A8H3J9A9_9LECA|nr:MAG: hypothetical protein ALECFALPRED_010077 [Alectoria fallacina]
MFFTITRLGLALSAPSLILTQSVTTYSFTANGTPTSLVFSIPTVQTTTVTYTQAAYTMTLTPAPMIETRTFTVTAPGDEISSIAGAIPQSVQVVAPSVAPGPIVPVVIHGYTTSIQIPATASIPEGTYTPSPVHIAAATPVAVSTAAADASQAAANAQSAASEEGAIASNVAGDANPLTTVAAPAATAAVTVASNAAADVSTTVAGIPTHLPIPIVPLIHASAAVQSADATASASASNAGAGASSAANGAVSVATEGFASTASVPRAIITDTTSLLTPTPIIASVASASAGMVTSTTSTAGITSTTSSSAARSSSSSAPPSSSSSSTAPAPSTSSTAAPKSGAKGRKITGNLLGAVVGVFGLFFVV